jgi:carboxyl-terminal processing protease
LVDQIKSSGIKYSTKEFNESKKIIEKQLYALIARNIIGDKGFYPIIFEIDNTVKKAVDILNKDWSSKEIVQCNPAIKLKSKQ